MSGPSTVSKQRGMIAFGPWVSMGAYLWAVCEGRISIFGRFLPQDSGDMLRADDISVTLLVKDRFFVMGTKAKGAGIYDIKDHRWFDFKQIREREIKRILYKGDLLWFLTDRGIFVYEIRDQQSDTHGFFCRLMSGRTLDATDLVDIKVYSPTHALAITEDRGCYLFIDRWTDKLLGGDNVPGLTQDAIKLALYWQKRIIVMGESFGIAAYDPLGRNWSVIRPGPLHPLTGMTMTRHRS